MAGEADQLRRAMATFKFTAGVSKASSFITTKQVVVRAVELVMDHRRGNQTHVLDLLHCLIDSKTHDGPDVDTPQALTLLREPEANVERYDGLRVRIVRGRNAS